MIEERREIVVKQTVPIDVETNQKSGVTEQIMQEKGISLAEAIIEVRSYKIESEFM